MDCGTPWWGSLDVGLVHLKAGCHGCSFHGQRHPLRENFSVTTAAARHRTGVAGGRVDRSIPYHVGCRAREKWWRAGRPARTASLVVSPRCDRSCHTPDRHGCHHRPALPRSNRGVIPSGVGVDLRRAAEIGVRRKLRDGEWNLLHGGTPESLRQDSC